MFTNSNYIEKAKEGENSFESYLKGILLILLMWDACWRLCFWSLYGSLYGNF